MRELKFKKDAPEISMTDDFWYMINRGGYIKPHDYLETEDAKLVQDAIDLLRAFEQQGEDRELFLEY